MNRGSERFAEMPTVESERPRPARTDGRQPAERIRVTAQEKQDARNEDARQAVEALVRAAGLEGARTQIERRMKQTRERIEKLDRFDAGLQEDFDFLRAEEETLNALPEPNRAEQPVSKQDQPAAREIAHATPRPSVADRIRTTWNALKQRVFGAPTIQSHAGNSSQGETKTTQYEQTWTKERLAQRADDRDREVAGVQERAIDILTEKLGRQRDRLRTVTDILSKRRREPIPAHVRARYVTEVQTLKADIQEAERLLRIASAREERERRKAA